MVPVLLHGDAAFAGQGVVMETLGVPQRLAIRPAARFTSSSTTRSALPPRPGDARRHTYCTDVAKMIEAPIFHVNGDDPGGGVYRDPSLHSITGGSLRRMSSSISSCFRKLGHNEGDEPIVRSPSCIRSSRSIGAPGQVYAEKLIARGRDHRGRCPKRSRMVTAKLARVSHRASRCCPTLSASTRSIRRRLLRKRTDRRKPGAGGDTRSRLADG